MSRLILVRAASPSPHSICRPASLVARLRARCCSRCGLESPSRTPDRPSDGAQLGVWSKDVREMHWGAPLVDHSIYPPVEWVSSLLVSSTSLLIKRLGNPQTPPARTPTRCCTCHHPQSFPNSPSPTRRPSSSPTSATATMDPSARSIGASFHCAKLRLTCSHRTNTMAQVPAATMSSLVEQSMAPLSRQPSPHFSSKPQVAHRSGPPRWAGYALPRP